MVQFWSTYTLEIFAAVTWGGIVRHRQSQCNVLYPAEVRDDHDITLSSSTLPITGVVDSFMHGWNRTTDLYRILEHLVERLRARKFKGATNTPDDLSRLLDPYSTGPSTVEIERAVDGIYQRLPSVFTSVHPMVGDIQMDRFGFQGEFIKDYRHRLTELN
jgi:hypothetical protein